MPAIRVSRQVLDKHFVSTVVGQPITEFLIRKGKDGDSIASSIVSIDVRTQSGEILNLIYKSMSPVTPYGTTDIFNIDSPEAKFRNIIEIYSIEIQFYKNIAPALEQVAKEKLPIPKLYSAEDNTDDGASAYLVLEDLRPLGFKIGDKFKGLGFPEVALVMKAISKFHAQSYVLLQKHGDSLFVDQKSSVFVDKHPLTIRKNGTDDLMVNFFEKMYQEAAILLRKRRDPTLADRMSTFIGKSYEAVLRPWRQTDEKYFPVLNHGDLWVQNMLFLYEKPGSPTEVKFIDFQKVYRGTIYDDLLYFFFCSTTPEFRSMHLFTCFEIYFESFSNTLEALDTPLPDNFSLKTLTSSYTENLDSGFCHVVFAIPFQLGVIIPPPSPATPCEGFTGSRFDNFENVEKSMSLEEFLNTMVDTLIAALANSERGITRLANVVEEMIRMNVL